MSAWKTAWDLFGRLPLACSLSHLIDTYVFSGYRTRLAQECVVGSTRISTSRSSCSRCTQQACVAERPQRQRKRSSSKQWRHRHLRPRTSRGDPAARGPKPTRATGRRRTGWRRRTGEEEAGGHPIRHISTDTGRRRRRRRRADRTGVVDPPCSRGRRRRTCGARGLDRGRTEAGLRRLPILRPTGGADPTPADRTWAAGTWTVDRRRQIAGREEEEAVDIGADRRRACGEEGCPRWARTGRWTMTR